MRQIFTIVTPVIILMFCLFASTYIDSTGTYKMVNGKTKLKDRQFYGYIGEIQVKKIKRDIIIINFYVNKGAPSYNSGGIFDTLEYKNNKAIYTGSDDDTTCKITFYFERNGIKVDEKTADFNHGCGFGYAVVGNGFYKKVSSKTPILIDQLTGEKLGK